MKKYLLTIAGLLALLTTESFASSKESADGAEGTKAKSTLADLNATAERKLYETLDSTFLDIKRKLQEGREALDRLAANEVLDSTMRAQVLEAFPVRSKFESERDTKTFSIFSDQIQRMTETYKKVQKAKDELESLIKTLEAQEGIDSNNTPKPEASAPETAPPAKEEEPEANNNAGAAAPAEPEPAQEVAPKTFEFRDDTVRVCTGTFSRVSKFKPKKFHQYVDLALRVKYEKRNGQLVRVSDEFVSKSSSEHAGQCLATACSAVPEHLQQYFQ